MEMTKSILAIEDVTFSYGKPRAVDRISLRIPPSSVVGLIGPNRSGKSATIRLSAGLLRPDKEGWITWVGTNRTR